MGLFDYVYVKGPAFVCSEGHDLSDEEFQTKDLGCTMGSASIGTHISTEPGGWGDPTDHPLTDRIEVYCTCRKCPAFVQSETFNTCDLGVTFEVEIAADEVRNVKRTSESTAEFLVNEPNRPHMDGCRGPMAYEDAKKRQIDRKFFPWDPTPTPTPEAAAAQRKWREEIDSWRAKYAKKKATP